MAPITLPSIPSRKARQQWRLLAIVGDFLTFSLSVWLSFALRFDGTLPAKYFHPLSISLCLWAVSKTIVFSVTGVNRGFWRYTSIYDAARIAVFNSIGSGLGSLFIFALLGKWGIPRSIYVLEWILSCFLVLGVRLVLRSFVTFKSSRWVEGAATKTLIYGAGAAGQQLLREVRQNRSLMCDVIGFVDDDPGKVGLKLDGKPVLGTGKDLEELTEKHRIKRLFIAIPSATKSQMACIVRLAVNAGVEYKMVPSLGDLIKGKKLDGQIRDIAVEDLLGRQSIQLNQDDIRQRIEGRVVIVTGAAGSIGSELCRQIASHSPKALVGFDIAETPLFQIERELRKKFPRLVFYPEIGNVVNPDHLMCVMKRHQPSVVYHAAAYKHVPLMETHIFAAAENNILGTWQTALVSIESGVEDFVMISSDKAVRPTSMMGATKRMAELVIRALQTESCTKFVAVRFGNVLGSNGSVVPIFKEQIAAGGPVTVTHPEMCRYFMTIDEAAQLVLQAFSIGKGGDVFLLDMGNPVKIVDLAKDLIMLSGLRPGKDIKIQFTGLRPGEKLFEELNMQDESLLPTSHNKIRRYVCPPGPNIAQLGVQIEALREIIERRDVSLLISFLQSSIPDYSPDAQHLKVGAASGSLKSDIPAERPGTMLIPDLGSLSRIN